MIIFVFKILLLRLCELSFDICIYLFFILITFFTKKFRLSFSSFFFIKLLSLLLIIVINIIFNINFTSFQLFIMLLLIWFEDHLYSAFFLLLFFHYYFYFPGYIFFHFFCDNLGFICVSIFQEWSFVIYNSCSCERKW